MAYIDKDKLFKELDKAPAYFESGDIRYGIEIAKHILGTLPTADVVEVKHGKWKKVFVDGSPIIEENYGELYECSLCGNQGICSSYNKFCSRCGAKMDLKGSDTE